MVRYAPVQKDCRFQVGIYVSDRLAYIDSVKYYGYSLQLEDMKENIIYKPGVNVRLAESSLNYTQKSDKEIMIYCPMLCISVFMCLYKW